MAASHSLYSVFHPHWSNSGCGKNPVYDIIENEKQGIEPSTDSTMASSLVENFTNGDVPRLTVDCRKRVEAFEAAEQKARQWETYFSKFLSSQQQDAAKAEEFRKYLNEYQTWWTAGHAFDVLDPRVLLARIFQWECAITQFKDQLTNLLTKWKNDQALAQIGKPSNAEELAPLASGYAKLDNKLFEMIGFVQRIHRFASERLRQCQLTEMDQFWQKVVYEYSIVAMRFLELRRDIQRESFLVFEQPPYIVRRSSGKASSAGTVEENASGEESGDEKYADQDVELEAVEQKYQASPSKARSQPRQDPNNGDQGKKKTAKENKQQKVVFDLRVRLMVGDKGRINNTTKVHAILLTDQQCRELMNKQSNAYDDPLVTLTAIGPAITAPNGKGAKRKIANGRRRSCIPGTPPFAAGHLTPHEASLTYDSSLEHFEAFFQNMKVNEKDRNPEADAQSRFYRILFVTKLTDFQGKDFFIWCFSLPFPIVVNATRQERATSAKIFCHLALSTAGDCLEPSRPCHVGQVQSPTSPSPQCPSAGGAIDQRFMTWKDFFDCLNWWWVKHTGALNGLRDHERYLASKVGVTLNNAEGCVSLEQVTKKFDGLDFSFWDWLFMIADFVKKNKDYWNHGFVVGFVSKEQVNSYLASTHEPVMMFRFSDSMLGSLVISYGMAGREPQHILLHQKVELKQYKLTYFIEHSKQLLSVNYFATSLNPADPLKHKSEFLQLGKPVQSQPNDDSEVRKRGYTKPRLAFDWIEPPPLVDFNQIGSVEQDDRSPGSSVTLEEIFSGDVFDNTSEISYTDTFTYDDLAADPNGFSSGVISNGQVAMATTDGTMFYEQCMWNGACNGAAAAGSPVGPFQ